MSMDYDPEVPAGYQEADILQSQYEAESRQYREDVKRGICHHSWMLGGGHAYSDEQVLDMREKGDFPERNRNSHLHDLQPGEMLCLDCGAIVPDPCP